ncbi:hypothetical protein [Actomonas aquatica]|uniref:Uncharacterized protein n=1 Tax=Actomonas aquatica TaxID=2866162 RepID=A0ABZ1C2G1_9BACT|nr:hypothetical protein [Opitutus sp. WL0086]WRQ85874.1 hypothetical protein K1X11_013760 [Opitutus sp. WL0086]
MPSPRLRFVLRASATFAATLLALPAAADDNATAPPSAPDIRLFSGIELAVRPADALIPVIGIEGNRFVLDDDTHSRIYPSDAGSFSAHHRIKLSRTPLTIDRLQAVRSYTPEKDPVLQGMILHNEMAAQAQIKTAAAELKHFGGEASRAQNYRYAKVNSDARDAGQNQPHDGIGTAEEMAVATSEAFDELMTVHTEVATSLESTMADDLRSRGESAGDFDALDISFLLSTPTPVRDAYAVVIASVAEEGQTRPRSFYETIGDLGPKPRRVYLRRTGFKAGFTVENVTVHVYARGQELVSNLSAKNTPLTAEQTRDYLLLSYLSEHATESLPAQPVWSLAPPALLAAESASAFDRTVAINLDADGSLISIHDSRAAAETFAASIHDASTLRAGNPTKTGTFADSMRRSETSAVSLNQSARVPAHIVAALQDMYFLPALDGGEPVMSTTEINLATFFP